MTDRAERRPVAEKISVGPWTISVRRASAGKLFIEVLLDDAPHAKIELEEGAIAGEPPRPKLERDMDY
jgi:hypothetical protein